MLLVLLFSKENIAMEKKKYYTAKHRFNNTITLFYSNLNSKGTKCPKIRRWYTPINIPYISYQMIHN